MVVHGTTELLDGVAELPDTQTSQQTDVNEIYSMEIVRAIYNPIELSPRPATLKPASPAFGPSGASGERARRRAEGVGKPGLGASLLLQKAGEPFATLQSNPMSHLFSLAIRTLAHVSLVSK